MGLPLGFAVLGPLEVRHDDVVVPIASAKQRVVLATLVLRRNEVVSADDLADALWHGRPPESGRGVVHNHLSRLRKALAVDEHEASAVVETVAAGYRLRTDGNVDIDRFERLCSIGRDHLAVGRWHEAATSLTDALSLWRGVAFADVLDADALARESTRLEALRDLAMEDRIEAELHLGRHGELVGELERLVDEHPLHERLWTQLMRALYAAARPSDALRAYTRLREHLRDELGVEPGPEVRRLEADILCHAPELGPATATRRVGRSASLSSFVGRDADLSALADALDSNRLVTVTGPGGVGKTRLATELVSMTGADIDASWFVELASLRDDDEVDDMVATTLGVGSATSPRCEIIGDAIGRRDALLVLDNAEHVVDGVAKLVVALCARCPNLRVLVTSREPLDVSGERVQPLGSLDVEDAKTLFVDRARAVNADAPLPDAVVKQICSRVDGIPMAVELAAARVRSMTPTEIAARLDQRFQLLTGGRRDRDERQRTLFATIDWSYRLLSPDDQVLFARLAVFGGSFDAAAAEAVAGFDPLTAGTVVDGLDRLTAKSMVSVDVRHDRARFRMLESLRDFAADRLGTDLAVLAHRQATYFTEYAERLVQRAETFPEYAEEGLVREFDNFRTASTSAVAERDVDLAVRLTTALYSISAHSDVAEVGLWVTEAARLADGAGHPLSATAHGQAAFAAALRVDVDAYQWHVARADGSWWQPYARCWWPTSPEQHLADSRLASELAAAEPLVDVFGVADAMFVFVAVAYGIEHEAARRRMFERAERDPRRRWVTCMYESSVASHRGDIAAAFAAGEQALAALDENRPRRGMAHAVVITSLLWLFDSDRRAAIDRARNYLVEVRDLGSRTWMQCALSRVAVMMDRLGRPEPAAVLAEFSSDPPNATSLHDYDPVTTLTFDALDPQVLAAARHRGHAMDFEGAVVFALEQLDEALSAI